MILLNISLLHREGKVGLEIYIKLIFYQDFSMIDDVNPSEFLYKSSYSSLGMQHLRKTILFRGLTRALRSYPESPVVFGKRGLVRSIVDGSTLDFDVWYYLLKGNSLGYVDGKFDAFRDIADMVAPVILEEAPGIVASEELDALARKYRHYSHIFVKYDRGSFPWMYSARPAYQGKVRVPSMLFSCDEQGFYRSAGDENIRDWVRESRRSLNALLQQPVY